MKNYRRQIVFLLGAIILALVISGFLFMENGNTPQNANHNTASIPATASPATPETPDTPATDIIASFETWQANYQDQDLPFRIVLIENYPLFIPDETDIDIPEYYGGYDKQIVKIAVSANKAFIAINYRFKENVGGGTSAYAANYGWDIDQQFGVLYAMGDLSACVDENFVATLNEFNLENGLFIITPDNAIIETDMTSFAICSE